MTQFYRREVYYCDFPSNNLSVPTQLPPPDYNLRGRHMAIMLTDHNNPHVPDGQALVIPISSLKDANRKDVAAYIPLKAENNPFLNHDSFAKVNQIQPIDQSWIKSKVGDLHPKEMNMVNIGVMLATGTYKYVEQYIDQEVTRRVVQAFDGMNEVAAAKEPILLSNESHPVVGKVQDFRRADVIKTVFPRQARNHVSPSQHRLEGEYLAVCMTDYFNYNVPKGQVLVVPLLRADQVNPKNLDAVVAVPKKFHEFLDCDFFAQTNLIQPLNRNWIQDRIGQIGAGSMKNVNVGVLQATGSYHYIENVIDREVSKRVFAQKSKLVDRTQPGSTRGPSR